MATIQLPPDFKEFLQLLNLEQVEYLLVGGFAVAFHGYPRSTGDMDIWVATSAENAQRVVTVLRRFGFSEGVATVDQFQAANNVMRIGMPPVRIDLLTGVSGLEFAAAFANRTVDTMDGVAVNVISLADLKANKTASARPKDVDDLQHLP